MLMATLKISSDLQNVIKKVVLDTYFPVGSLYLTVGSENPNNTIGGTWVRFGNGRTLVGVDTSQTEFNTIEKTGGEKTHKLTLDELPEHQPEALLNTSDSNTSGSALNWQVVDDGRFYGGDMFKSFGGDKSHNNLQPYITVYMWKRTK